MHRLLDRADAVIATSRAYADSSEFLRTRPDRVRVIPLGVDPRCVAPTPERLALAEDIRSRSACPLVLFIGRLVYYKGVDILLQAMCGVRAGLAILGQGPLQADLGRRVRQLRLEDRVHFYPHQDEDHYAAFLHACDLLVLPSVARSEAFGLVQVEAHLAGKPVVGTDLPTGVPWVNLHEQTGLVVPPGNARALEGAIRQLVEDEEARRIMGQQAQARATAEFSLQTMLTRHARLYRGLVD
jgi:rhamnosyl/mannosyltransferase